MKKIWNCFFACCIFTSIFGGGFGQTGDCFLSYENGTVLSWKMWYREGITLPPLNDTVTGENKLLVLNYEENMAWDPSIHINGKLLDKRYVRVNDGTFTKKMSFETFDFDKYEEFETEVNMTISIFISCAPLQARLYYPDKLVVKIPIIDTNNHAPEFLEKSYEYALPMPLAKGFDITSLGPIVVKDIDLTNDNVTFAIEGLENKDDFSIAFVEKHPLNLKHHVAKFVTTDTVDLEDDVTFTLTATDAGNPPRSANVSVTFKIDRANSEPRFSQPFYTADLTVRNNRKKTRIPLKFPEGHIVLTHGYGGDVEFQMSDIADELKKHFKFTVSNETREEGRRIDLELVDTTDDFFDRQRDFFTVLKAVKSTTEANTVLYIRLSSTVIVSEQRTYVYSGRMTGTAFFVFAVLVLCYLVYTVLLKKKSVTYDVNNVVRLNDEKMVKY